MNITCTITGMPLLNPRQARLAQTLSDLAYCNPFSPQRQTLEKQLLGSQFDPRHTSFGIDPEQDQKNPNRQGISEQAQSLALQVLDPLKRGGKLDEHELQLYEDLVLWTLYHRYRSRITLLVQRGMQEHTSPQRFEAWTEFARDAEQFLGVSEQTRRSAAQLAHGLAVFFQIRRAFHHIFSHIVGSSLAIIQLRAAVWQSIFTHDMHRYRRGLYDRMGDYTTLIVGPSGTGKELVARAIGLSRYIPFDVHKRAFTEDFAGSFAPLNLSAMSPTLIESELFGHRRGSFTGALADRAGWLEACPPLGTVFLDEIGDLDASIQVKLLRVLQSRTFQRIGDTKARKFAGKIIAATNRDLGEAMRANRFREDFYYRLCSDMIVTPSLRRQLADCPDDLQQLILFIARRVAPQDAPALAAEVQAWVDGHLGADYAWPGNVRELEQCVCNVLIRREYHPAAAPPAGDAQQTLALAICQASLSADELLTRYCTLVYAKCGSYLAAAQQLGLDRRTVKARIDRDLLQQLQQ